MHPRTRRDFLRMGAAASAALLLARRARGDEAEDRRKALEKPLPQRDLGKTGRRVSQLGLGCFPLGNLRDEKAATDVIRRAVDLGVTYFDSAPSYNRGVSETRVGSVIKGAVREKVFLTTKSTHRDGRTAVEELEGSLQRLGTDHVDLFQFHAVKSDEDLEAIFGRDGAWDALVKAKEAGKVRHLGITGHEVPAVLARAARERAIDTLLFPLNCVDPHRVSFERGTLPVAKEKGLGIVAMKVFASGKLLDDPVLSPTVEECIRYTLGLPVATAIVGCASVEELERDLACAKTFTPLTPKERVELVERTRPFVDRKIEWYKRL